MNNFINETISTECPCMITHTKWIYQYIQIRGVKNDNNLSQICSSFKAIPYIKILNFQKENIPEKGHIMTELFPLKLQL